jgi:Holliday junction resolvase RusA-like endonuclease
VIDFIVYGPPQGKGRPRVGRAGAHVRMFTPQKTLAYEGLVAHCGAAAMAGQPLVDGAVELRLLIDVQIPASWSKKKQAQALAGEILPTTKPDVDNVIKAIGDGLNGVVWKDDVQITDVITRKRYAEKPQVRVMVRPAVKAGEWLEAA